MADYRANFYISCGVSPGLGVKSPSHDTKEERFSAEDNKNAIIEAAKRAIRFSRDYLSNPAEEDFTTVTITNLFGPEGEINVKDYLTKMGFPGGVKRFDWNSQNQLVTKCHMLEHALLAVAEAEAREKAQASA